MTVLTKKEYFYASGNDIRRLEYSAVLSQADVFLTHCGNTKSYYEQAANFIETKKL